MKKVWIIYIVPICLLCFACRPTMKETDRKEVYALLKQADSCSRHRQEKLAIEKYFEILEHSEQVETPLFRADIYKKIGTLYLYRNLYVDAIDMFRRSATLYQQTGAWKEEALAWRNIGRANLMRHRSDSIIHYYQRAIGLAEEMGEHELLNDLQREYQFVCSKNALLQTDSRLWLHYLDMLDTSDASYLLFGSIMANQPLHNEESEEWLLKAAGSKDLYIRTKALSISLHELGESYEKQRMEAENERLKNQQLERTLYGLALIALLCVLIWMGLHLYIKERRRRERELARLMQQIREKESVIEDLRKHQHEKEKREGVSSTCEGVLPKRYKAFDLLYRLKMEPRYGMIADEDEWLEVYAVINLLYGDIVGKLEKCSQLTEQDVRICYLLHARLGNAEIATLFNVDARSVSKSKQRIKKKMDITSGQLLEEFLMK